MILFEFYPILGIFLFIFKNICNSSTWYYFEINMKINFVLLSSMILFEFDFPQNLLHFKKLSFLEKICHENDCLINNCI